MTLFQLKTHASAIVAGVEDRSEQDPISRRLREIGFVPGEAVKVVGQGLIGREPLLVQVGFTRFALRRNEAERVTLREGAAA
jgi:ferrous iron transport protein A